MADSTSGPHLRPVPDTDPDDVPVAPVAVDNPALPDPKVRVEKRKPVLAGWLTNRRDFLATARHTGANVGYAALYHGVRVPVYAGRLASWSPGRVPVRRGDEPVGVGPRGRSLAGVRRPYGGR